jgi:hypothetical protein
MPSRIPVGRWLARGGDRTAGVGGSVRIGPPDKAVTMTTHNELKRLVRARMARTGESYTTARRQILARAARRSGRGQHHESTLLACLLERAGHRDPRTGHPYTETTLCGLAGGIGFLYAIFEYRGELPIVTVVAQHHPQPWAPAALTRLGITHEVAHSSAPRAARGALDRALDSGQAVQCVVSRARLPWYEGSPALDADPYPVVVLGRRGDALLVQDGPPEPYPIAADDFAAAWSAHRKGRHARLTVGPPDRTPDLPAAMRDAIATTVGHLTGPVLGNSFDVNMGFSGMARLSVQLRDTRGSSGWTRRMAAPGALPASLRRLHACLEAEYTAPAATRPLYAGFLDEAAEALAVPALHRAADHMRTSGTQWSSVAATALAAAGKPGPAPLGELADAVDAALAAEQAAVAIMAAQTS